MVSDDASRWLPWTFFRPVVHVKVAVGSDASHVKSLLVAACRGGDSGEW